MVYKRTNPSNLRPITELSAFTYEMVDNAVNDLYGGWEIISDEMRSRGATNHYIFYRAWWQHSDREGYRDTLE